jgi:hypothetical protein
MNTSELFAILSGVIVLFGGPPYLYDILKGKTKPQRTTWFIWTVLGVTAFVSQLQLGAHWSLVFVGLNGAGNLLVFLLSLRFGVGGWKLGDVLAAIIAGIGIVTSLVAKDPLIALLGVIGADFTGTILTLQKTFILPSTETSITWFFLGTSSFFAILSVGSWDVKLLLYPVYMMFATYGVLVAQGLGMWLKPKSKSKKLKKA